MKNQLLQPLIGLLRRHLGAPETTNAHLTSIAANTRPLASGSLLTRKRIYRQEAIDLLGISERTYERKKANGELKPRGMSHDFYYPEDLEEAMAESRRKGRV